MISLKCLGNIGFSNRVNFYCRLNDLLKGSKRRKNEVDGLDAMRQHRLQWYPYIQNEIFSWPNNLQCGGMRGKN